jgi:hypothetical protein
MGEGRLSVLQARVFISCGQSKNSDEVSIASQIEETLCSLGFNPYVAVQEQTLRGLKENIFEQLSKSEYFIFVDFKREPISDGVHRGSLFCHQELAIASYLNIPVLAFQESGVKSDDGIVRFIQMNAVQFTDRHLLPGLIAEEVTKRKETWDPCWRNSSSSSATQNRSHELSYKIRGDGAGSTTLACAIGIGARRQETAMPTLRELLDLDKVPKFQLNRLSSAGLDIANPTPMFSPEGSARSMHSSFRRTLHCSSSSMYLLRERTSSPVLGVRAATNWNIQ